MCSTYEEPVNLIKSAVVDTNAHVGSPECTFLTANFGIVAGAKRLTKCSYIAGQFMGSEISERRRLQKAFDSLDPIDCEILVLRHFEQLTNGEAAEALNLEKSATSKRYVHAMERLKGVLTAMPGGGEDLAS
jgi:hypothetical protein